MKWCNTNNTQTIHAHKTHSDSIIYNITPNIGPRKCGDGNNNTAQRTEPSTASNAIDKNSVTHSE